MKVKDAIKRLQKMNPEAILVVRQYNGGDDVHRPVEEIKTRTPSQLAWPLREGVAVGRMAPDHPHRYDIPDSPGGFVDVSAL